MRTMLPICLVFLTVTRCVCAFIFLRSIEFRCLFCLFVCFGLLHFEIQSNPLQFSLRNFSAGRPVVVSSVHWSVPLQLRSHPGGKQQLQLGVLSGGQKDSQANRHSLWRRPNARKPDGNLRLFFALLLLVCHSSPFLCVVLMFR